MDPESADRGEEMNQNQSLASMSSTGTITNMSAYVISTLASMLESDNAESQSLTEFTIMIFKNTVSVVLGMCCRITSSIASLSVSTFSCGIVFENGSIFEDACYVEYLEHRKLWCIWKPLSKIPVRRVKESELTQGCRDLILRAGCTFMTSVGTPTQESRPIEVPFGLFGFMMRSLGFDIAHKGQCLVYGPRMGRPIRSIVSLVPDVDQDGEDSFHGGLDIHVEDHVLKAIIHIATSERATTVVHRLKAIYKTVPFTDNGRETVRRKLRVRTGSMVLV